MQPLKDAFSSPEQQATENSVDPILKDKTKANRTAIRLASQRWTRRQRQAAGFLLFVLLVGIITTSYWADRTGRIQLWRLQGIIWLEHQLADRGLALPHIEVAGLGFTSHDEVRTALAAFDLEPLIKFSPNTTKLRLENLAWVENATVQRTWPSTLRIWLNEREPIAILHENGEAFVVDQEGEIIIEANPEMIRSFPNVSGNGAAAETPRLIRVLTKFPEIYSAFVGANRQTDRRWDLYLAPGVEVKLPATDLVGGLERLQGLIDSDDILTKEITSLDLRGRRAVILR